MRNTNFDEKLEKALHQGTDEAASLKEKTFEEIMSRIEHLEKEEKRMRRKSPRWGRLISMGTAAAVLLITFMTATAPGQAALGQIRQLFEPERQLNIQIEGEDEEINGRLQESAMGYVLYFDQERYKVITENGVDRIQPLATADYLPDMFMEISQVADKAPEAAAAEWEGKLQSQYGEVVNHGQVTQPLPAVMLYGYEGREWDSIIVRHYFVDNTQGGTFVIKQQFTVEAEEGHGVRFDAMLHAFKVVPAE